MIKKVPYFSFDLSPVRGDASFYHRMVDAFDLRSSEYDDLLRVLECNAQRRPAVFSRAGLEATGSTEILTVYDKGVYLYFLHDWTRVVAYENALSNHFAASPRTKRTLEVGCGSYPILSWLAYEAGARELAMCEVNPASFAQARAHFEKSCAVVHEADRVVTLEDEAGVRVTMYNLYSTDLELSPDARFDLYVHEILGSIASMEGCVDVYNQTLPVLADDARCVPARALTRCAPVRRVEMHERNIDLVSLLREVNPTIRHFVPQDPTVVVGDFNYVTYFPTDSLLAAGQVFEDLDFRPLEPLPLTGEVDLRFELDQAGPFDGLVIYMELHTDGDTRVDTLEAQTAWHPLYVRMFDEPIMVQPGRHRIRVRATRDVSIENMFYAFEVVVTADGAVVAEGKARLQLS